MPAVITKTVLLGNINSPMEYPYRKIKNDTALRLSSFAERVLWLSQNRAPLQNECYGCHKTELLCNVTFLVLLIALSLSQFPSDLSKSRAKEITDIIPYYQLLPTHIDLDMDIQQELHQ